MQKARNRTHYKRTHCFTTQIFRLGLGDIAAERVCVSSIHLRTLGVVGLRQLLELQLRWVRERSSLASSRVRKVREVFVYLPEQTENICFLLFDPFSNGCLAQRSGALKQELGTCGNEAFGGTQ